MSRKRKNPNVVDTISSNQDKNRNEYVSKHDTSIYSDNIDQPIKIVDTNNISYLQSIVANLTSKFEENNGICNLSTMKSSCEMLGCNLDDFDVALEYLVDQNKIMIDGDDIIEI
jgi:hypothetical protein